MAGGVALDGPARRQGQLDIAAVEDEHAVETEGLESLAAIHRSVTHLTPDLTPAATLPRRGDSVMVDMKLPVIR